MISLSRTLSGTLSGALARTLAATAALALAVPPALAHPHVWVATRSQALFENGQLTGLRFTWMFDEMYTQSAVEGLDTNKDGILSPDELAELTKINIGITRRRKAVARGRQRTVSVQA